MPNIKKENDLYIPSGDLQEKAWQNDKAIYQKASDDPIKFWEELAKELFWFKGWEETFKAQNESLNSQPYFEWFKGGKINITSNIFEKNPLGFDKIKNKIAFTWIGEPTEEKPRTFTYEELFREVNRFANALKNLGVKKGDRVAIYLPVIPEVIIAMLATARIGAVHSVVFSAFSSAALQARLQDAQAKILITADGYYRRGKVINLKQSADEGIKETEVEKIIVVKRAGNEIAFQPSQDLWWHELTEKESPECAPEIMDSEDLFFILYTSGSTGKPKGTIHACGGYAVQAKFTGKWIFDWKENDIFWSTADIGWITGHTYSCYSPLLNAATFIIFEGSIDWPNPERWASIIEQYKVSIFYTAPTAIRMFEKYGADLIKGYKFETLRLLGSVGEPIDNGAWQWYFQEVGHGNCPIVDTWWQTETGGILISSLPGIGPFKPSFTGVPFPGIKFDILDEAGKSVQANKEGNLVILSPFNPGLLRGIYKNPEKYFDTYWSKYGKNVYFTSDSAFKDENGLIRIVGRVDDVLKVAGHRFTTGELENIICLHPDFIEAAVVGKADEIKGEVPIVFAVSLVDKGLDDLKKGVVDQIRKEIGPIASPQAVYIVEDLPKTRSGKIMRRILKKILTGEDLGDLSTLANPQIVEKIQEIVQADIKNEA
ncbi:MAG: acetate--CoA ligase [Candidatus Pacebacteria bacterium]|nr:acetate--CoA ligase [Candidatus Paceibacterota bacterium]